MLEEISGSHLGQSLLRAGPIKSGFSGIFPAQIQMLQKFLRMEILQPLWAVVPELDCPHGNKVVSDTLWEFLFLTYSHCLLPYHSAPSIKDKGMLPAHIELNFKQTSPVSPKSFMQSCSLPLWLLACPIALSYSIHARGLYICPS